MAKDINKKKFEDSTVLKLNIFSEYFKEWLPVFNNNRYIDEVFIFDFFAGSGRDSEGNYGSPLRLLETARGENKQYCDKVKKPTTFVFNELDALKYNELETNINNHFDNCKDSNNCVNCSYRYEIHNKPFLDLFNSDNVHEILKNPRIAKFAILDQYGFKEITDDIFKQLISFPKTDFIFFISSSNIRRFKEHPNVKKYIQTHKIDFDESKPKDCHRIMAGYYRDLTDGKYYLHSFTLKKENSSNYWGLIFGTAHSLGMEKFLNVCWKYDKFSGEANFNIDNNYDQDSLFGSLDQNVKLDDIKKEIQKKILSRTLTSNIEGFKFALHHGCQPKIFTDIVKKLEKEKLIERKGNLNYRSTDIHKAKEYKIIVS